MARFTFKLPDIGEGISTAEIVAWHVAVGDRVEEDQRLADMMTDKATVEMESPVSGTVVELAGDVGDSIAIGAPLVVIDTAEGVPAIEPKTLAAENPDAGATRIAAATAEVEGGPLLPSGPSSAPAASKKTLASPAVRARAKDLGVDLAQVKPQGDRIRHADLDAYLLYGAGQGYRPAGLSLARPDEEVKVVGLRRRIAEKMAQSKRDIPHFSYIEEIDVTSLQAMRADLNAARGERQKLTILPFLIVAICKALPDFPMINARYDDEAGIVTRHGAVHLGVAVQTDAGLVVPVIRNAQDHNIWQLAQEIARLAGRARDRKLTSKELSGSTLTITSLGPLGGIASTPVINQPEVAIIAPNRVIERPVIRNGEIEVAKLMNLSVSCDHRVVDGWDAASFVQALRGLLETPVLLFAD